RDLVLGQAPFEQVDAEVARDILAEVSRLATEELADSLIESDRTPPTFDPQAHSAHLPPGFAAAYRTFLDAEFWRMALVEELGGTAVPSSLRWAMSEFVLGANPAM